MDCILNVSKTKVFKCIGVGKRKWEFELSSSFYCRGHWTEFLRMHIFSMELSQWNSLVFLVSDSKNEGKSMHIFNRSVT